MINGKENDNQEETEQTKDSSKAQKNSLRRKRKKEKKEKGMIPFLMFLILAASILQKDRTDFLAAITFSLPMISFWSVSDFIIDDWYYHLNSVVALAVMFVLNRIKTKLSLLLLKSLLLSILINAFGYILWSSYAEPTAYNTIFIAFYTWILYIMIKKGSFRWKLYSSFGGYYSSLRSLFVHMRG